MDMYSHVVAEGERLGIQVDMMTGTGWPFGGPEISIDDAADRYLVTKFEVKEGASLGEPVKYKEPAPQFRMPAGRRAPQRRGPQQTATSLESLMAYSSNGDIIDLTDKVAEDGTLNWVAEKGDWTLYAIFNGKALMMVKRAAPGGEGYVMDHYNKEVLDLYTSKFDKAFGESGAKYPHTFFNDSFELANATWEHCRSICPNSWARKV